MSTPSLDYRGPATAETSGRLFGVIPRLAFPIAAVVVGTLGPFCFLLATAAGGLAGEGFLFLAFLLAPISLLLGVVGLIVTRQRPGRKLSVTLSLIGIVLGLAPVLFWGAMLLAFARHPQ